MTRWTMGMGAALTAALLAGCLDDATVTCGTTLCPPGTGCAGDRCVGVDQLRACADLADGARCATREIPDGVCAMQVCVNAGCGNRVLEAGEACDDGNRVDGDGCSAGCDSTEVCGNGVADRVLGETCDCGAPGGDAAPGCATPNSEAPDAACRLDCQLAACGDGVLTAPEQCEGADVGTTTCLDVGYYAGDLACAASCQYDVSGCSGRCGDGLRNGPELCDGELTDEACSSYGFDYGLAGCSAICGADFAGCGRLGWVPRLAFDGVPAATTPDGDLLLIDYATDSVWRWTPDGGAPTPLYADDVPSNDTSIMVDPATLRLFIDRRDAAYQSHYAIVDGYLDGAPLETALPLPDPTAWLVALAGEVFALTTTSWWRLAPDLSWTPVPAWAGVQGPTYGNDGQVYGVLANQHVVRLDADAATIVATLPPPNGPPAFSSYAIDEHGRVYWTKANGTCSLFLAPGTEQAVYSDPAPCNLRSPSTAVTSRRGVWLQHALPTGTVTKRVQDGWIEEIGDRDYGVIELGGRIWGWTGATLFEWLPARWATAAQADRRAVPSASGVVLVTSPNGTYRWRGDDYERIDAGSAASVCAVDAEVTYVARAAGIDRCDGTGCVTVSAASWAGQLACDAQRVWYVRTTYPARELWVLDGAGERLLLHDPGIGYTSVLAADGALLQPGSTFVPGVGSTTWLRRVAPDGTITTLVEGAATPSTLIACSDGGWLGITGSGLVRADAAGDLTPLADPAATDLRAGYISGTCADAFVTTGSALWHWDGARLAPFRAAPLRYEGPTSIGVAAGPLGVVLSDLHAVRTLRWPR